MSLTRLRWVCASALVLSALQGCKSDNPASIPQDAAPSATVQTPMPKAVRSARPRPAAAEKDWNDSLISWRPFEAGMEEARTSGKHVLLVIYTDWCPHCTNYSKVFSDPAVVDASKKFVMVRINQDSQKETSSKFTPDGQYVPRTLFLTPQGEMLRDIKARQDKFFYFFNEHNPASLLEAMQKVAK